MSGSIASRVTRAAAVAAALATLAAAPPAGAQHQLEPVRVVGRRTARANALHAAAAGMNTDALTYRKIAFMHLHSADLREASDPQAASCLTLAGDLLYFSGDLAEAQGALEEAGARAEARGDMVASANAFIDAGLVARERRLDGEAEELGGRAEKIASSPLVTGEQRAQIAGRVVRVADARTPDARAALLRAAMRQP